MNNIARPIRIDFINGKKRDAKNNGKIKQVYHEIFAKVQRNSFLKTCDSDTLLLKNFALYLKNKITIIPQKKTIQGKIKEDKETSDDFSKRE